MSLDFTTHSTVNQQFVVDDNNNNFGSSSITTGQNILIRGNNNRKSSSSDLNKMSSSPAATASSPLTGPVNAISSYIKHLFGLNVKTTKRTLSEEAECGSPESIQEWLRQGSNANECDAYGYTPLVNACLRGCVKSAKILLSNGADVNLKAMHGYSPLHAAAQVRK